jgi:hypothetical protein
MFYHGNKNRYQIILPPIPIKLLFLTSTGQIIYIKNFKSSQSEQWENLSTQFRITSAKTGQKLWLSFCPTNNESCPILVDDISLLAAGFNVDINRDGQIDNGEGPKTNQPFYFWINNDSDKTDYSGDDWGSTLLSVADCNDNKINSLRDLIDFSR